MPSIPKNNLRERLQKLGYNPNLITIVPPVLDNSGVVKNEQAALGVTSNSTYQADSNCNIKPPEFVNIDDWSDFEEDE